MRSTFERKLFGALGFLFFAAPIIVYIKLSLGPALGLGGVVLLLLFPVCWVISLIFFGMSYFLGKEKSVDINSSVGGINKTNSKSVYPGIIRLIIGLFLMAIASLILNSGAGGEINSILVLMTLLISGCTGVALVISGGVKLMQVYIAK